MQVNGSYFKGLVKLGVACMTAAATWAQALPAYQLVQVPISGDVTGLTALNDRGDVLLSSGQACDGLPCSFVMRPNDPLGSSFTRIRYSGLAVPGEPTGSERYTLISQFNSAGDAVGVSDSRLGGLNLPTVWRGGVASRPSDPANAGWVFAADPGASRGLIDLSTLVISNPPPLILPADWAAFASRTVTGWRNALGQFALEINIVRGSPTYLLLPTAAPVSEPGTVLLVASALAALAAARQNRNKRPSEDSAAVA
jgi:hypothetical protein